MRDNNRWNLSDEEIRKIRRTIKRVPTKNIRQANIPVGHAKGRPFPRRFNKVHIVMICLAVLAIAAAVITVVVTQKAKKSNDLIGSWSLDDVTIYSFEGNGHGEMNLPLNTYEFSYVAEEDKIKIDFTDDNAEDREYSYMVSGDTLILTDANGMEFRFVRRSS